MTRLPGLFKTAGRGFVEERSIFFLWDGVGRGFWSRGLPAINGFLARDYRTGLMSFWSRGLPAINGFMGFWKEPHPPHSYEQISSLQKPYPTLSFQQSLAMEFWVVEVKPLYVAPEDGKLIHRSQLSIQCFFDFIIFSTVAERPDGNDSSDEDEDESESEDEKITEKCKPETDVQAAIPTKSEAAAATKPESSAKPKVTFVDPKKDESDDSDGSDEDDDHESNDDSDADMSEDG
ncbi:hypothetical protein OROHE_020554 [Orobanche hederae]